MHVQDNCLRREKQRPLRGDSIKHRASTSSCAATASVSCIYGGLARVVHYTERQQLVWEPAAHAAL